MSIISQQFKDAVVSIGIKNENKIMWIGTGFFVSKHINNDNYLLYLVSNKHVLEGNKSVVI